MAFLEYSEVEVQCAGCGIYFTKPTYKFNATQRRGSNHYCSKSCRSKTIASRQHKTTIDDFLSQIDKTPGQGPNGDCWVWTGKVDRDGYGLTPYGRDKNVPGRKGSQKAHRVSFELVKGKISSGFEILHSCDTPSCCNPAHLSEGTHLENIADCTAKGRNPRGERVHLAKISKEKAEEVLIHSLAGLSTIEIVKALGVTYSIVDKIKSRTNWKDLEISSDDPRVLAVRNSR